MSEGSRYTFFRKTRRVDGKSCSSYVGFKDGKEAFRFSTTHFSDLNSIYSDASLPEERISLAMKSIRGYETDAIKEECYQSRSDEIAWITVALLLWPVTVPIAGGEVVIDLMDPAKKVHLGMNLADLYDLYEPEEVKTRQEKDFSLYVVDRRSYRTVFYFKDDILMAYVRGLNPDLWNKPSSKP